jgi:hypothetical protein
LDKVEKKSRSGGTKGLSPTGLIKKNYALPEKTIKIMEELRSMTDCATDTDVLKRALRLYDEVVKNGGVCMVRDSDGALVKIIP